jgi:hypothetical protein
MNASKDIAGSIVKSWLIKRNVLPLMPKAWLRNIAGKEVSAG